MLAATHPSPPPSPYAGRGELTDSVFATKLLADGFTRVERDDRLFDVFPDQIREKGIELWERWSKETVELVQIKLPYKEKKIERFTLERKKIERL